MSPPIRDGSGSSIGSIRLGDGSEISEVRTGAGDVLFSGNAIPDSAINHYGYEGDSSTSTAVDEVGSNDATIHSLTYSTSAQVGNGSLAYDGSNDPWLEIPKPVDYSTKWSFTTWVQFNNTTDRTTIATTRDGSNTLGSFQFRRENGSITIGMPGGSNYSSSLSIAQGEFVFLGFAYDGNGGVTFAVNDSTNTASGTNFDNLSRVLSVIGAINGGRTTGTGFIDHTSIHDEELTAQKFSDIYNNTS